MATLSQWQRIDRVLPGMPLGSGIDGPATISSDPFTRTTYLGTAGSTAGTAGSTAFANGDIVGIYQTTGTGATQWEINRVTSGGGTTSLVMQVANHYTFGTGAQIIKIPQYTTATISSFALTALSGAVGGFGIICAKVSTIGTGTITLTGKGFAGGQGWSGTMQSGWSGAGTTGASSQTQNRGDNAGGGGAVGASGDTSGGGGANGTAGGNGTGSGSSSSGGGVGGEASGSADLTTIALGGGGGGGHGDTSNGGAGGTGGGVLIIFTANYAVTGAITATGGAGGSSDGMGGGGGAGGSILIVCKTATLGSNLITAGAGPGGGGALGGGNGSVGRIAVHHSGAVTGTTSPTFTDVTDTSLVESSFKGAMI